MRQLQIEHAVWVDKKYPNQRPKIPAVGCLEEAGELVHAILKLELVQTWGEDSRHKLADLRVKLVDAIGDCGVFACSLCNANEWDFAEIWHDAVPMYVDSDVPVLDVAIEFVQKSAHLALYPTEVDGLSYYVSQLKTVALLLGLDAEIAIRTTWQTVKER